MDILAPVNTLESAVAFIDAGAGEIYLGADDELFETFSFTGRGKFGYSGQRVLSNFNEVGEIVGFAHEKGVKVNFLCNYPIYSNGTYMGRDIESYLLEYIEKGIAIGVDSIVAGDIGLLKLLGNRHYPVKLHASVYFKTLNEQQLLFLKKLGVTRTILSYHISMDEIEELAALNIMELEVIGYLGCSFFNGACSFLHDYGEGVQNDFDPGVSCKGKYKVNDGRREEITKLFDVEAGCALCALGKLENAGVTTLKIVGRERDFRQTTKVIELYNRFLELYRKGASLEELDKEKPLWWKKLWCSKQRCKYNNNNKNYSYMIGV